MRLVFLRLSALGDILRVLPAWVNLHEGFPEARIQAVVEDRHAFLLEPFPWLKPVIVRRKRLSHPLRAIDELKAAAKQIQGSDASLDFHGILKSALIPRFASIPERWGDGVTKEGARWLQSHPLPFRYQTRYDQALGLAKTFGDAHGLTGLGHFRPVLRDAPLPDSGCAWEQTGKPRVVMVPGASRRGAIKRWPLRHWMTLARMLAGRCELRWSLGPDEEELREWLPTETGIAALPKGSIWQLAAALREADRIIAPDTGLLHLAVVLGVPVVGVYGSSDPVIAGIPEGSGIIVRTGIACAPCRERRCLRRDCMEELLPERVAACLGSF
jgi:ADP-heptose:LPS heptosyltransferase